MISFEHALWQHYTVFDGMGGMRVEDIHQDRQGFIWIATADGGVSRFDGVQFDNFTDADGLPHPTATCIVETSDGRLWCGTMGGGLAAYDGHSFQVYTTDHGLPSDEILGLHLGADDSLLVATRNGVGVFAGDRCRERLDAVEGEPIGLVYDMATDGEGRTWLATLERGVVSTDGRRLRDPGPEGEELLHWAWKLTVDPKGCLWVAPKYTGTEVYVYRYDSVTEYLERVQVDCEADSIPTRHGVRHVRSDRQGWIWITHRGVMVFDGENWQRLPIPLGGSYLSDTRLTFEDREGNIWVGSWGGGLACCDPFSVRRFTETNGLPDLEVTCLAEDRQGSVWVGTMGGLARMREERIETMSPDGMVLSLLVDTREQIWCGTDRGQIFCRVGEEIEAVEVVPGEHEIKALYQDYRRQLWIGVYTGEVGVLKDGRFAPLKDHLPWVQTFLEDRNGRLWIGTHGASPSLHWYDGRSIQGVEAREFDSCYVYALCETADGTLWIGTGTGLLSLREGAWRRFTVEDGLSENAVLSLAADPQGGLWIGTSGGGAVRYDGRTFQVFRLGQAAAENIVEAILVDAREQVWFGTRAGLATYRPGHVSPCAVIRQVVAGQVYADSQAVVCPETIPEVRVRFQGIGFRAGPRQMRYSYRLLGQKAEPWTAFAGATEAVFATLVPGDYRFEVRAMDRDGLVSAPASLELTITPDPSKDRIQALALALRNSGQSFIGQGAALQRVLEQLSAVASTDMTVLITGETGTGKGLAARLLHESSPRKDAPFIQVNCGGIPAGLVESELFGHEKGAFTGAVARRLGRFELAEGGTLFLDEIGDLPLEAQRVLLQVLEEGMLQRVGSEETVRVNARVVAATNRDLRSAMQGGGFREDLFYRLNEFSLEIPPLRQRREDIPLLARYFARRFARHLDVPEPEIDAEVTARLQGYAWPGNVRELEHLVHRAVLVCRDGMIRSGDIPEGLMGEVPVPERQGFISLEQNEKEYIERALEATHGVVYGEKGAARLLGMHPEKLRYRMKKLGLRRPE